MTIRSLRSYSLAAHSALITAVWLTISAFAEDPNDGHARLFVIDRDRSNLQLLDKAVLPGMKWNGSPEWSRDGSRIVFDATPEDFQWRKSHIAVYHLTGPKQGKTDDLGIGKAPTWSPDGKRIAFFTNPGATDQSSGTWIMNADGTNRKRLGAGWFPNWSPDGRTIACTTSFSREHLLKLYDLDSGQTRNIGGASFVILSQMSWSPDGTKVAVGILQDAIEGVGVCDVATGKIEKILWYERANMGLPAGAKSSSLAWSPTGDEVLVRFTYDGIDRFHRLGIGRVPELEPNRPAGIAFDPAWSPDGKRVVFCSTRAVGGM